MPISDAMLLDSSRNRQTIDMARSIGILMVVQFHVLFFLAVALEFEDFAVLAERLPAIFNIGFQALGSEIIFLLSSFLLCYLMFREAQKTGTIGLRDFYIRRVSRILPLYYLAIGLYALGTGAGISEIFWSMLFVGVLVSDELVVPVGWSMEAMMQAFILLPLLCLWVLRVKRPFLLIAILFFLSVIVRVGFFAAAPIDYRTIFTDFM
ncbi:MAG: acyltransferase family protein, partial [Paracoccaceae bacterium]